MGVQNIASRKILDTSKRASGQLTLGLLYLKKQSNDTWGSETPFWMTSSLFTQLFVQLWLCQEIFARGLAAAIMKISQRGSYRKEPARQEIKPYQRLLGWPSLQNHVMNMKSLVCS